MLQSLIGLFELPEDDSTPDDEHFIEIEDTPGVFFIYNCTKTIIGLHFRNKRLMHKRLMQYRISSVTIYQLISIAGYQAAFSQLVFAGKKNHDPCAGVGDAKVNLAKNLQQLSQAHPGKVKLHCTHAICKI